MKKKIHILFLFFCVFILKAQQQNFFPIIAFQGIPEDFNEESNFKKLKDAGFNVNLNMYSSSQKAIQALELGQKMNIKMVLSIPEIKSRPEEAVKILKNYSSFLGYYIEDEPNTSRFEPLSDIVSRLRKADSQHFTYINLFPNYATNDQLQASSYKNYVEQYLSKVKINLVSFDHYSVVNNTVRPEFYENLEIIRSQSQKFNKPFWGFACTAIHFEYRQPTLASLRLQQFGNILYGAQGIQYYTYWSVNDLHWRQNNYSYAIVDEKGNPTPTYSIVKTVNEQIQKLAWIFSGAKSDAVYHMGNEIPSGTSKLYSVPKQFKVFSTYGKNALISLMSKGKNKFIIVQNKSLNENLNLDYRLQIALKKVDNNSGKSKLLSVLKKYNDIILPGDILIFTY
ncbi:hypothetical protein [Chryseobacterium tongliaoense]|uniref:hypothetical protein n=1 Tax=Chryseobacterium tongliaoense TaxID=3240933 RepID=UPI0035133CF2